MCCLTAGSCYLQLLTYALGVLIFTLCHGSLRLKEYTIASSKFVKNENKKGTKNNTKINKY